MCWCVLFVVLLCVCVYVFACVVCDVLCDVAWVGFCIVCVCAGALLIIVCDVCMMNGVVLSGFVLCCCVFARSVFMCVL